MDAIKSLPACGAASRAHRAAGRLAVLFGALALGCSGPAQDGPGEDDPAEEVGTVESAISTNALELQVVGRYSSGIIDADWGATEVSAYDPRSRRLFVVNVNQKRLDVVEISDVKNPTLVASLPMPGDPPGDPTSVATHAGVVAVSSTASVKTDPGQVEFYDAQNLGRLAVVTVGASPDMVTFAPNGRMVLTADEGEPSSDYAVDPPGSVSMVDLGHGFAGLTQADVTTVGFDDQIPLGNPDSIRIYGHNLTVAQNLEPEYVAVSPDGTRAWITLQENNAIAELDLRHKRFTRIVGLGYKDHGRPGNGLDASDKDGVINIAPWPVWGMYEPDAIESFTVRAQTYLVTANEGDAREWGDVIEEVSLASLPNLDPAIAAFAADKTKLGRLNVTKYGGFDTDGDGDIDRALTFGARSFSIWTAAGEQVYDSGDELEQRTGLLAPTGFNSDNKSTPSLDKRSSKKGPEPEGLTIARLFGREYLFLGLERIGGVAVYDLSNPRAPAFVTYVNSRDYAATDLALAGDLGPEGLLVIPGYASPTRRPLLAVSNEVSGTVTLYQISRPCRAGAAP